jgi:hypothetical protein
MKLENLIIKLNTSYDIEDIDEVEANGTSKAEAIDIVNDMCWEEINDQIEEVLDDVKSKHNYEITKCELYLDEISELRIDAEIDETKYASAEEAKEEFIKNVTKAVVDEGCRAYHSLFVLDDETTIWIDFDAIEE